MVKHSNNKRKRFADFIRYQNKGMTDSERNAFERELQKDPFDQEAAEGFSNYTPEDIAGDLNKLENRLNNRTSKRKIPLAYRYAAAMVVLVVVSSILVINRMEDNTAVLADNSKDQIIANDSMNILTPEMGIDELSKSSIDRDEPESKIMENIGGGEKTESLIVPEEMVTEKLRMAKLEKDTVVEFIEEEVISAATEDALRREKAARSAMETGAAKVSQPMVAGVSVTEANTDIPAQYISGRIISSEDSLPLPGVLITIKGESRGVVTNRDGSYSLNADSNSTLIASLVGMKTKEVTASDATGADIALDVNLTDFEEVVVAAYSESKKREKSVAVSDVEIEKEASLGYIQAQPADGWDDFLDYIKQNQEFPVGYSGSGREVVRIKCRVNENGYLYDFEMVRSPSTWFFNESIRLLKEGPAWNPSTRNGQSVEDSISLRIVFRR